MSLFLVLATSGSHGKSDLCTNLDMKPVLSLDQITQAELIDYLVQVDPSLERPTGPGVDSPEALYQAEVKLLIDNGYPPILASVEPDHLVTRRYFASVIFDVAVATDPNFASQYGDLTDETERLRALVQEEWLYAEEGNIYRDEILSVLCSKEPQPEDLMALDLAPEDISDAELTSLEEAPRSPY
jgi:hypothetical protein